MLPDALQRAWPNAERTLQAGDIIVTHRRRFWAAQLVQEAAGSYWNHTGLVFLSKKDMPVGGPLIVEASNTGIEIHQMKKFSGVPNRYDIGVLRYPGMTEEMKQEIVTQFILGNLDTPYDFRRLIAFIFSSPIRRISTKLWGAMFKRIVNRKRFVCSTFVHKAFHDVSVHQRVSGFVETQDKVVSALESEEFVTPGDIANDPTFEWIFNQHD